MRENGFIRFSTTTGGGFDVNHHPVKVSESWSDPVPALITKPSPSRKSKYQDGEYITANYEIQVEEEPLYILAGENSIITSVNGAAILLGKLPFTDEAISIKITDSMERDLGAFRVIPQNINHLDTIERFKIYV